MSIGRRVLQALPFFVLSFLPGVASDEFVCPGNTTADQLLQRTDLTMRVAIVTGGDAGIGYAAASALAKRGATVVIANRNQTSGELAAKKLEASTGGVVRAAHLDLGSLTSVRDFADWFMLNFGPRLHILVNNAGIAGPSVMDSDGFELVYEVDYLGHFLLTELLLPALRKSAPSTIINIASGAHENACEAAGWPLDCFKDFTYLPPPVVPKKQVIIHYRTGTSTTNASSYGIAKFSQIQHAAALATREAAAGISAFSLTPGLVLTGMSQGGDPARWKNVCETQVHPDASIPTNPCPYNVDQGAAVIASCLTNKALRNGAYLSRVWACQERPVAMQGFSETMQAEFYERTLKLVGGRLGASSELVV